eukprot:364589-Chlamydomonas_euryale.AAC.4
MQNAIARRLKALLLLAADAQPIRSPSGSIIRPSLQDEGSARIPDPPCKPPCAEAARVGLAHSPGLHSASTACRCSLRERQLPDQACRVDAGLGFPKLPARAEGLPRAGAYFPRLLLRGQQRAVHIQHTAALAQALEVVLLVDASQEQRLDLLRSQRGAVAPQQRGGAGGMRHGRPQAVQQPVPIPWDCRQR